MPSSILVRHCRRPLLALILTGSALSGPVLAQEDIVLDTVILNADGSAVSGGTDYVATTTATRLKSGAPLVEVPQSVSAVTAKEL
jgi:outer membrane receptor for ferric coprogen and ferric-rhodotorulic acid